MLNFWFKCEQENLILKFMYWPLENLVQSSLVISLLLVQELSWLQDQDWLAYAIQAHFGTGIWAKWALKFIFKKDIPVWVSISDGHWKISIQFQKIREITSCTSEKKSDFHMTHEGIILKLLLFDKFFSHAEIWFPHDPYVEIIFKLLLLDKFFD